MLGVPAPAPQAMLVAALTLLLLFFIGGWGRTWDGLALPTRQPRALGEASLEEKVDEEQEEQPCNHSSLTV